MKQFIPAWYDSKNWWNSTTQPFYIKRKVTEFDDMISLISMHQKNNSQFNTIILNYQPMLRLFLHRYGLYEMSYWSLFDDIQGVAQMSPQAIDYRDLEWPEDTEFIYTPFQVIAITSETTYSKMNFSQEGYLFEIETYKEKSLQVKYLFDDRGFISSIEKFQNNGQPSYKEYLDINGHTIMIQSLITQKVEISRDFYSQFEKIEYSSIEEIIYEKLSQYYFKYIEDHDKVIVAADQHHNDMINKIFDLKNLCFSVFTQRNRTLEESILQSIIQAQYCIVDTLENEQLIKDFVKKHDIANHFSLMRITPFDVQTLPNMSSQLYETNIGVWIDSLNEVRLKELIDILIQYSVERENIRLHLLTRKDDTDIPEWLTYKIKNTNEQLNKNEEQLSLEVRDILETEVEEIEYIKLIFVPFEEHLLKEMSHLRVMIDLGNEPDLYLQISSISVGIPQINQLKTNYVDHKLNGLIINDTSELIMALDFYLLNLKNWNYSFAHSIKLSEEFSSSKIITQLNHLIEGENNGT